MDMDSKTKTYGYILRAMVRFFGISSASTSGSPQQACKGIRFRYAAGGERLFTAHCNIFQRPLKYLLPPAKNGNMPLNSLPTPCYIPVYWLLFPSPQRLFFTKHFGYMPFLLYFCIQL